MEFVDKDTKKTLEFQNILNKINPITSYGIRSKSEMKNYKLGEEENLRQELDIIEAYIPYMRDEEIRKDMDKTLSHIKDLNESFKKAKEGGILTEVELFEIKEFLFILRDLKKLIKSYNLPTFERTKVIPIKSLENLLDPENTQILSFYIYDNFSLELSHIRTEKRNTINKIRREKANLKEKVENDLEIKLRLDNSIIVSKDKGEIIEKLRDYPHITYESETYISIGYILRPNEEILLYEEKLNLLRQKEEEEELKIRKYLSKEIGKKHKEIRKNILNIASLDLILAKAKYAIEINGVRPNIIDKHLLNIQDGRHPIVEEFLKKKSINFTPISISLNKGVTCITGANMGGKTISLKLIGLLSVMAQYGLFVPAKSMDYGLNQFIKSSIGDAQSIESSLSTFGGEIERVQGAISNSDKSGLILIDELARGTNPKEGYAISKAIVNYLKEKSSISLLTTHYESISNEEDLEHFQVVGLSNVDILDLVEDLDTDEKLNIINKYMDYRLKKVNKDTAVPKDALNIARLMGLDREIVDMAEVYLE